MTPETERDYIRHVRLEHGYTLKMWDLHRPHGGGPQQAVGYEFRAPDGTILFQAEDYGCSPCHAVDSDESVRCLLGFLTLRPGDTDEDYFADYTAEQLAFADLHAEELSLHAMEEDPLPFEDIEPL